MGTVVSLHRDAASILVTRFLQLSFRVQVAIMRSFYPTLQLSESDEEFVKTFFTKMREDKNLEALWDRLVLYQPEPLVANDVPNPFKGL